LSDLSWQEAGEEAVRNYKKGDDLDTVVLAIDPERERISLGVKQLQDDPFNNYVTVNEKGAVVKGKVTSMDAKSATITLADDVTGILKSSDVSRDKVEDIRNVLKEGEEVEAKIITVDRKNRQIGLSIKAKDMADEKEAIKDLRSKSADQVAPATIGDLIKAQMEK
jgi:small subunit ribosomal protein S1